MKNVDGVVQEGLFVNNEHQRNLEEIKEYDASNDKIAQPLEWKQYFINFTDEQQEEVEERLDTFFGDPQNLIDQAQVDAELGLEEALSDRK